MFNQTPTETTSNATMEATSSTIFYALPYRANPTDHLKVLRGNPGESKLLTNSYMSPSLHNSSDTYHRHLHTQLMRGIKLNQPSILTPEWFGKAAKRHAFMKFTRHLAKHSTAFLHRAARSHYQEEEEIKLYHQTKKDFTEDKFVEKEERKMASRGWSPEDWHKIQKAIIEEEKKTIKKMQASDDSTRFSRLFESEDYLDSHSDSDIDSECGDESDESEDMDEDYRQFEAYNTFIAKETLRMNSIQTANDFYTQKKLPNFEEWIEMTRDQPDHFKRNPSPEQAMESPSSLLLSWCYRPSDEDDSDSEDVSNIGSTASSSRTLVDSDDEDVVFNEQLYPSPAHQRKAEFQADLVAVRKEVQEEIERDWEEKVEGKAERLMEQTRQGTKSSWWLKRELELEGDDDEEEMEGVDWGEAEALSEHPVEEDEDEDELDGVDWGEAEVLGVQPVEELEETKARDTTFIDWAARKKWRDAMLKGLEERSGLELWEWSGIAQDGAMEGISEMEEENIRKRPRLLTNYEAWSLGEAEDRSSIMV